MTGTVFIINIPRKEYETILKNYNKNQNVIQKHNYENLPTTTDEFQKKNGGIIYSKDDSDIDSLRFSNCPKKTDTFKCKSENQLTDIQGLDRKSNTKTSWEDIKHMLQRRSKFEVTKAARSGDILEAFHWDTPLETILSEVITWADVKNATWHLSKDSQFWQVMFSIESGHLSEELLQVLRTFGIGSWLRSTVSVVPCSLYYKSNDSSNHKKRSDVVYDKRDKESNAWSQFSSSVRARTNLAQVVHDVRAGATLTFDWLFMLLVAAFVAAIGLIENSTVVLVASMLISPLMGPVIGGTLGTAVKDRSLQLMGLKNEFLGVFLTQAVGFVFGLTICVIDSYYGVVEDWPTYEMITRCEYRSLWVGVLIAIPTGAGVALAVLGEYTSSLVGVAISASLLPPAVNAGLLWAMAVSQAVSPSNDLRWLVVNPKELAMLGTSSLCLTLVNIACIFLAGVAVFKVKEVYPLDKKDITWWKANKNRYQASKRSHPNNKNLNCGVFYEQEHTKNKVPTSEECNLPNEHYIDINTETFGKRPSHIRGLRAQNI